MNKNAFLDAKNAFLDAKNSLLMVRILARLDIERPGNEWLDKVISEVENANGYQKKVPLVNQAVFLSMAYSTLVWLRESYFKNDKEKKTLYKEKKALSNRVMPLFSNHKIKIDKGKKAKEIGEKAPIEFIRRIRNSLGHANVSIEDDYFIFYDVDPREEDDSVKIIMSWHALGELTEMVIAAGNDVLFETKA